ncbi:polysaccharide deacetylase [Halospina denitrificans]|uniref:Polysaccharide deacetylase n=1 Tax=Halospina denitrificans TaxID=332522 RepID=A0A4R7JN21_9GAMM|nr:polysaccharide deacetylase family protein [Halospina denitrificans]TDT39480.1 polysaccharide deacetylase [Halospina denitrificans]
MTLNHLIYRLSRTVGAHHVVRYLARDHPRIFMYHRITEYAHPGAIDQASLRQHMRLIRQHFNPVPLPELIDAHNRGETIPHAVAVTFDDGYRDFYDLAMPVLREEGIPATLFVTTGFADGNLWLWPDKLRYCFECTREPKLELPGYETTLDTATARYRAWECLADQCLLVGNDEKHQLIEQVADALNVGLPVTPPERYAGMSWDDIRVASAEGVDLGSHTVSHPTLTSLPMQDVAYELESSKERISAETGQAVRGFCYPNGKPGDFDRATKAAIRDAGYDFAVAAYPGLRPLDDLWAIRRYSASANLAVFEKALFGFTYVGMKGALHMGGKSY